MVLPIKVKTLAECRTEQAKGTTEKVHQGNGGSGKVGDFLSVRQ